VAEIIGAKVEREWSRYGIPVRVIIIYLQRGILAWMALKDGNHFSSRKQVEQMTA